MAIEDLDLEFEDDEEENGEALDVNVDLTFSASPNSPVANAAKGMRVKPTPKVQSGPAVSANNSKPSPQSTNNVTPINKKPIAASNQSNQQRTNAYANSPSSNDVMQLRAEIEALRGQIEDIQHSADIRVAVAEAEKEYLVEYVSNAKVLDHQITGILQRVNAKVPQLKGEMQTIKKYLQDFLVKSSSKK